MSLLDHDQHLVSDGASLRLMHTITRVPPEWLIKGGQPYLFIKQPAEQNNVFDGGQARSSCLATLLSTIVAVLVCVLRCGFFIWHPYSVVRTVYPWIVAGFSMFSCLCRTPSTYPWSRSPFGEQLPGYPGVEVPWATVWFKLVHGCLLPLRPNVANSTIPPFILIPSIPKLDQRWDVPDISERNISYLDIFWDNRIILYFLAKQMRTHSHK